MTTKQQVEKVLDHIASFYALPRETVGYLSLRTLAELDAIKPLPRLTIITTEGHEICA